MSMSRLTVAFVLGFVSLQLTAGAAIACENPGKTHKLSFKVKDDGCVVKVKKESTDEDAETINVCESDVVEWKVRGSAKSIVFDDSSPFEWVDSGFKGDKIEGKVKSGTAGNEFKYSVKVDGLTCVHDPKIIVDR
jgi:hypothetical protein